MKSAFSGYYAPTEAEYDQLWKEGLIVLDTNVLLDLYRLPEVARHELLEVLNIVKNRLWIPHQVALEFQKRRLTVIASERRSTEAVLNEARNKISDVCSSVSKLQIDKRGVSVNPDPLLDNLKTASAELEAALRTVHDAQLDIHTDDPVRVTLDKLLDGRVGPAPENDAAMEKLIADGVWRYDKEIPPGYKDADKEKNPKEAVFFYDGVTYQRKFGDLILWRQLINHAKENQIKKILLITSDQKEDWWWKENGKTLGPRTELSRELRSLGGTDLFWMYSSDQFLNSSKKYAGAKVSQESVAELKEVSRLSHINPTKSLWEMHNASIRKTWIDQSFADHKDLAEFSYSSRIAVRNWIYLNYADVHEQHLDFPDFISDPEHEPHGFELKLISSRSIARIHQLVHSQLSKASRSMMEGKLYEFTLILVIRDNEVQSHIDSRIYKLIDHMMINQFSDLTNCRVLIGNIDEENHIFTPTMIISRDKGNISLF